MIIYHKRSSNVGYLKQMVLAKADKTKMTIYIEKDHEMVVPSKMHQAS